MVDHCMKIAFPFALTVPIHGVALENICAMFAL